MAHEKDLVLPIYLNEKIVIDMLAVIEDGFSMVSEISTTQSYSDVNSEGIKTSFATSNIFSKLLKIQLDGEMNKNKGGESSLREKSEKVHTSVSLFSKLRNKLLDMKLLGNDNVNIKDIKAGDFVEVSGQLLKNPMIDIFEKAIDVFRMADIFSDDLSIEDDGEVGDDKAEENILVRQIKMFLSELKVSGTVDFVMENEQFTTVLSAQEQYLENDNISELLGGRFKVLGKVLNVCNQENESINLLRKTTLNILGKDELNEFVGVFESEDFKKFNLPKQCHLVNSGQLWNLCKIYSGFSLFSDLQISIHK